MLHLTDAENVTQLNVPRTMLKVTSQAEICMTQASIAVNLLQTSNSVTFVPTQTQEKKDLFSSEMASVGMAMLPI